MPRGLKDILPRLDNAVKTVSVGLKTAAPNYVVRRCGFCEAEVALDAGDVTYGGEWYHAACWILAEPEISGAGCRSVAVTPGY